jgi:hypothetical protein
MWRDCKWRVVLLNEGWVKAEWDVFWSDTPLSSPRGNNICVGLPGKVTEKLRKFKKTVTEHGCRGPIPYECKESRTKAVGLEILRGGPTLGYDALNTGQLLRRIGCHVDKLKNGSASEL